MLGLAGSANAALQTRGEYMIYDDSTNLTWLKNPTFASNGTYDDGFNPGDGRMTYASAVSWVSQLTVANTDDGGSVGGWRLPNPIANTVWGGSDLAQLIHGSLGNPIGATLNFGPFSTPPLGFGWLGSQYELPPGAENSSSILTVEGWLVQEPGQAWPPSLVWGYTTNGNFTGPASPSSEGYAWAVRDGDVLAIPEPEVYASMLVGIVLVGVAARRRKQTAPAQFL
ncbi:MAG TPA: hypothetical protein DEB56_12845 [Thiobacillus sp.]|nr:hypothetical protein [Thiobacillus sp.]